MKKILRSIGKENMRTVLCRLDANDVIECGTSIYATNEGGIVLEGSGFIYSFGKGIPMFIVGGYALADVIRHMKITDLNNHIVFVMEGGAICIRNYLYNFVFCGDGVVHVSRIKDESHYVCCDDHSYMWRKARENGKSFFEFCIDEFEKKTR